MTDFLGAPYPIVKTARGLLAAQTGVDQVKADLLQLLLTNPGERVMLLDYGTPLRELIFEPDDSSLDDNDLRQDTRHILMIKILFFDPEDISALQELKLEVPLAGQAGG